MLQNRIKGGKKGVLGEMAEWSNAVDSKSIVRFTAYLGFESLSHRQQQQKKDTERCLSLL